MKHRKFTHQQRMNESIQGFLLRFDVMTGNYSYCYWIDKYIYQPGSQVILAKNEGDDGLQFMQSISLPC